MARLYVANPTRQDKDVHFRLTYRDGRMANFPMYKRQTIPKGKQVALGGDLDMAQIEDVVQQLSRYGMLGTIDLKGRFPAKRIPLLFSVDRQIPRPVIEEVVAHNDGVLTDDGRARRRAAAVAANEALLRNLGDDTPAPPEMVVDMEQDEQTEAGEKRIEEGVRVLNRPLADAPPPARAPKKPARRGGTARKAG